jgi:cell division protease FtsH
MSEKLGPRTFGTPLSARFLEGPMSFGSERNYSEEAARIIDEEVRAIIETEYERARKIMGERREVLKQMADRLLTEETLQRAELEELVGPLPVRTSSCPA